MLDLQLLGSHFKLQDNCICGRLPLSVALQSNNLKAATLRKIGEGLQIIGI